jgi:hypothetical protein
MEDTANQWVRDLTMESNDETPWKMGYISEPERKRNGESVLQRFVSLYSTSSPMEMCDLPYTSCFSLSCRCRHFAETRHRKLSREHGELLIRC